MSDDQTVRTQDVLLYGLRLRDRVAGGERPHLGVEQNRLRELLGPSTLPAPWGAGGGAAALDRSAPTSPGGDREFLGIRYALTCWLDEIMLDAGWNDWDNNKLEQALYRMSLRYKNFWDQARLAEAGAAAGTQEAFLLCVLLGFRGEMGAQPDRLREWVHNARSRVTRWLGQELPALPERAVVTAVPPLTGVRAYHAMTRRVVAGTLAAVVVSAFLVVVLFRR